MMPSGTPNGGSNGPPSYLRTNSLLGQSGAVPAQPSSFPSLVSPRIQFGNNNTALLGNMSNPSSLLNNSFGNGSPSLNASHVNLQHGGGGASGGGVSPMDMVSSTDQNPLLQQQFANPGGNQMSTSDHRQGQQVEPAQNNYQRQFSIPHNQQHQQQQQQLRVSAGSVKIDPQMGSPDQIGTHQQIAMLRPQHQLSSLNNNNTSSSMGPVKLEPQQSRSLGSFKLESHQHSDPSLFLQQQQQQQLLQQMRIEAQGKYMQSILEKACNLAGENMTIGSYNSSTDLNIYGNGVGDHQQQVDEMHQNLDGLMNTNDHVGSSLVKKMSDPSYNCDNGKSPIIWADDLRLQELGSAAAACMGSRCSQDNQTNSRATDHLQLGISGVDSGIDIDSLPDIFDSKPVLSNGSMEERRYDISSKLEMPSPRRTTSQHPPERIGAIIRGAPLPRNLSYG